MMSVAPGPFRCSLERARLAALIVGVGLSGASCGPGVATPMPEPPTLNLSSVGPPELVSAPEGDSRHIAGKRGTAPPGAVLRVTNLDQQNPPSVVNVRPDGSFDVIIGVSSGEELRFDWALGGEQGAPQDARVIDDATSFHLEPAARFACVKLMPGSSLDFAAGATQRFIVRNDCSSTVSLSAPRTRLGSPDFALNTALPLTVPSAESASLDLSFTRAQSGAREDTLFIDLANDGTTIRYPITLRAPASL